MACNPGDIVPEPGENEVTHDPEHAATHEVTCVKGKGLQSSMARRLFLARLGIGVSVAGATVASSPGAAAQVAADVPWRPARHAQDDWLDKIPGVHRYIFDTTTAEGLALAFQFASNYFTANQDAYGLKDSDLAVVIVARHKSTAFGYNDTIWAKYRKQLSEQAEFMDPKTKEPPKVNVYAGAGDGSGQSGRMEALTKKGVHFAVCQTSTRGIAGRIARATGVETESVIKEIGANLVGNAHFVPAGIVTVNRAQEHGYSFVLAI
jgi:intracellular sulfur oxidation DsrE/DsrF family protein